MLGEPGCCSVQNQEPGVRERVALFFGNGYRRDPAVGARFGHDCVARAPSPACNRRSRRRSL